MPTADRTIILGPGEGKTVSVFGDPFTYKVASHDTNNAYSIVEVTVSVHTPPPHPHHNEDEGFYVLEGELEVRVGDRTVRAPAGSFVLGPKGVVHGYSKVGLGPAKLLEIFSPAGFEHFFEEISGLSDPDRINAIAQRYNVEIAWPSPR